MSPRSIAPASKASIRARAAARSLGLSYLQTLRYVVVPQAVRRIMAPLLNDFIGLQKDTALVQVIGVVDAFNQSRIIASNAFNLSAVTIVAILFVLITIPQARFVDRLIERDQRPHAGGELTWPSSRSGASTSASARSRSCAASTWRSNEHQVVCLIGPSGCGKSTLLRCINGLEPIQGGEIRLEDDRVSGPGVDVNRLRREVGIVFQSFNLFPHMSVMENVTLAPIKVLRLQQERGAERAMALLRRIGLEAKARGISRPPVGRPAAARRHRPRARHGAEAAAARRDHLGARSRARLGGAEHRARPGPPGHDHAARHP